MSLIFNKPPKGKQFISGTALFKYIAKEMLLHADPEQAVQMKRYMRDQFEFLGIKSPLRKEIFKSIHSQYVLKEETDLEEFIHLCWEDEYREMQYMALEFWDVYVKKLSRYFLLREAERAILLRKIALSASLKRKYHRFAHTHQDNFLSYKDSKKLDLSFRLS